MDIGRTTRIKVTTYLMPETKAWVDEHVASSDHNRETVSSFVEAAINQMRKRIERPLRTAHGALRRSV